MTATVILGVQLFTSQWNLPQWLWLRPMDTGSIPAAPAVLLIEAKNENAHVLRFLYALKDPQVEIIPEPSTMAGLITQV